MVYNVSRLRKEGKKTMKATRIIRIGKFTFVLYKSFQFGFLKFDNGLRMDWWLDVGPLAIIMENRP